MSSKTKRKRSGNESMKFVYHIRALHLMWVDVVHSVNIFVTDLLYGSAGFKLQRVTFKYGLTLFIQITSLLQICFIWICRFQTLVLKF